METLVVYQSPFPKIRLGHQDKDGGYLVAHLPGSYDYLVSGGISDDVTFEQQFLSRYDCDGVGFDGTISELPDNVERLYFVQQNITSQETETTTNLLKWIGDHQNVFLKLDIEGWEFEIVPVLLAAGKMHQVKQFVLEIHTPCDIHRWPDYYSKELQTSASNAKMFEMIRRLNETHTIVHFHGNNVHHGNFPDQVIEGVILPFVYELTFVRNDFIPENKLLNTQSLPTAQDCKNSSLFPDYELSGWPYSSESPME